MMHPASPCLPFAGLGHDLACVASRAKRLMVRHRRREPPPPERGVPPRPYKPWGYSLLLDLCREIRGQ